MDFYTFKNKADNKKTFESYFRSWDQMIKNHGVYSLIYNGAKFSVRERLISMEGGVLWVTFDDNKMAITKKEKWDDYKFLREGDENVYLDISL